MFLLLRDFKHLLSLSSGKRGHSNLFLRGRHKTEAKKKLQKLLKEGNCLQFIGYQQLHSRQAKSVMLGSVCFLMRSQRKHCFSP